MEESDLRAMPPKSGAPFLWLGVAFTLLSMGLFIAHLQLKQLYVPWHVPIVGTIGIALVVYSLALRRSIPRYLALVIVALVGGMEWYVLGIMAVLPAYQGPAVAGKKLPAFATTLADGAAFTDADLIGPQATVMTFFRGRW